MERKFPNFFDAALKKGQMARGGGLEWILGRFQVQSKNLSLEYVPNWPRRSRGPSPQIVRWPLGRGASTLEKLKAVIAWCSEKVSRSWTSKYHWGDRTQNNKQRLSSRHYYYGQCGLYHNVDLIMAKGPGSLRDKIIEQLTGMLHNLGN